MPAFSIICASYNYEKYLDATIRSVLAQSCPDWELIVVDDGSSDGSRERITSYAVRDPRIRFFTHPDGKNHGLVQTVRLALSHCTGEYVAFLESDDLYLPECLAWRGEVLRNFHPAILANDVELFGDEQRIRHYDRYFRRRNRKLAKFRSPGPGLTLLLEENFIPTFSSVTIRRDVLERCTFENIYAPWLDRFLYVQAARLGDFYYLPEVLTRWRIHSGSYISVSELRGWRWRRMKYWYALCRCAWPDSTLRRGFAYAALLVQQTALMIRTRLGMFSRHWRGSSGS